MPEQRRLRPTVSAHGSSELTGSSAPTSPPPWGRKHFAPAYREGGGAHSAYDAEGRLTNNTGMLPLISKGLPLNQLFGPIWEHMQRQLAAGWTGDLPPVPSQEELNAIAQSVDDKPRRKF